MSGSSLLTFLTGISIAMLCSLLIAVYVLSRLVPKKCPANLMLVGRWLFSFYLIQLVFRNLQEIFKLYWEYPLGYPVTVECLRIAVCYRYCTLVNECSANLLTGGLQVLRWLLIYFGIQIQRIRIAFVGIAVCTKRYPIMWAYAIYRKVYTVIEKPRPPRLLTEEEYRMQGEVETRRALEELRKYCNSPEFSAWKAVSRIQSPKRFADFVQGASHLFADEISVYNQQYGLGVAF
ncbi:nuclear envelope integral membrane protein 1-like [Tiliqua scincoides]|uniref:nuclear envelope integral membrane protein 1-like n=1 Tax=Tiliqua scincoides TaxID=71010 RepID=UPI003463714E